MFTGPSNIICDISFAKMLKNSRFGPPASTAGSPINLTYIRQFYNPGFQHICMYITFNAPDTQNVGRRAARKAFAKTDPRGTSILVTLS